MLLQYITLTHSHTHTYTQVATFVDEAVKIAQNLRTAYGPKLKDFKDALEKGVSAAGRGCVL